MATEFTRKLVNTILFKKTKNKDTLFLLYKNDVKTSRIWVQPSCGGGIICHQSLHSSIWEGDLW